MNGLHKFRLSYQPAARKVHVEMVGYVARMWGKNPYSQKVWRYETTWRPARAQGNEAKLDKGNVEDMQLTRKKMDNREHSTQGIVLRPFYAFFFFL
jgi:hypothetical protein